MSRAVTVKDFVEFGGARLKLEVVAGCQGMGRRVGETTLNRPQLALAGFYEYFAPRRIQLIGMAEYVYLSHLAREVREERLRNLFLAGIPCLVFTRHKRVFPEVPLFAEDCSVPVIRTRMVTKHFVNAATMVMESMAAPRAKVQGTMLEVAGLGLLLEGPPGIGKSETALGLIKRGHALVADDITSLRRTGSGRLLASPVELVRHYINIRGIGIMHVPSVFGVASVRGEKALDLVVRLRRESDLDRMKLENEPEFCQLLGGNVPRITIPVAPGRDLVNIVETAALEYRLRFAGQVAERDLDQRLKQHLKPDGGP